MSIFLFKLTSDVDELIKASKTTFEEIHIHEESISDVQDTLAESSTHILDDINVSENDTSDLEHAIMESSMPIQVTRYSLVILMIEVEIEHVTVDTSIVTSSKPSEFSGADCGYVITLNFFSFSESVKFFIMVPQVTRIVSSFSEYLELFLDFDHISIGPNDVILLAVSDVRPLGNSYISLSYL